MARKHLVSLLFAPYLCVAQTPVIRLTMHRAIEMAQAGEANPELQIAQESERIAGARFAFGRASRLPQLEVGATGQNQTRNLDAQGFRFETPAPGFTIPDSVGPFNTLDNRVTLTQTVLDLGAMRRSRAASASVDAAAADTAHTRNQIALNVARAYVLVLREAAQVAGAESTIARARATLESAKNKYAAGTGTAIDVTRAEYQLARSEEERTSVAGEREKAMLSLLDVMGLSFDTLLELEDELRRPAVEPVATEEAVTTALRTRPDLEAERHRAESARLSSEAIRLERLPTVAAYADAGTFGGLETHTIAVSVRIPIFDGGRRKERAAEASAILRQETARETKLQRTIELQVRQAQAAMRTAAARLAVSESYMAIAQAELDQARRRHDAGVTSAIDVLEAQSHVAAAARSRIDALYQLIEARIDAAYAAGKLQDLTL